MSTHFFQSFGDFFMFVLHHFVLAKLATSSIRVKHDWVKHDWVKPTMEL